MLCGSAPTSMTLFLQPFDGPMTSPAPACYKLDNNEPVGNVIDIPRIEIE